MLIYISELLKYKDFTSDIDLLSSNPKVINAVNLNKRRHLFDPFLNDKANSKANTLNIDLSIIPDVIDVNQRRNITYSTVVLTTNNT